MNVNIDLVDPGGGSYKLPAEIGRWRVVQLNEDEEESYHDLVDCQEVISPEVAKTASPDKFDAYQAGLWSCIDPVNSKVAKF